MAEAYHRHRPGYPATALDWALAPLPPLAAAPRLLDLGAGTGKLTAALVDRAASVTAVEPDIEMLAVLRAMLPTVTALAGSAEAIPLPDTSVDAVLVGQAFHWFDPEPATAEIVRVLRPGGVVAALWNMDDPSVDWVRGYYEVVRWAERSGGRGRASAVFDHCELRRSEMAVFGSTVPMTVEGLLDNLGTFSWISTLPDTERATTFAKAREYLVGRPETASGEFELPMRTEVLRATRR